MTRQNPVRTRPPSLIYWVDERPPVATVWLLGLQHVCINAAGWVIMAAVLASFMSDVHDIEAMIRMGMIAVGVGCLLQSMKTSAFGTGVLCPPICGPAYASASVLAGTSFGVGALFGMTLLAGVFETVLARLLPRLRSLFPPEVIGVIMTMVGVGMLPLAMPRLLASPDLATAIAGSSAVNIQVGLATLALMFAIAVWAPGRWRLYPSLLGVLFGWILAWAAGCIPDSTITQIAQAAWFDLPHRINMELSFEWSLVLPFLIAATASSLKGVGDLTLCQKANDANWKRTDFQEVSRGGTVLGMTTVLSGLLGTLGHSASSSNVGLSIATGATSRFIGLSMGALMILLAFIPKASAVIALLPAPIMGAMMVFVATTMIVAGLQIMSARLMDIRRIILAGATLAFGLSAGMMPKLYEGAPIVLAPILASSVSFTAALAIGLHLILRIGSRKTSAFEIKPGDDAFKAVQDHLMQFGGSVGARRDSVMQAIHSIYDCLESLQMGLQRDPGQPVQVSLAFDEAALTVKISYQGSVPEMPRDRPAASTLLDDPQGVARMSAYLASRRADHVDVKQEGQLGTLILRFEH